MEFDMLWQPMLPSIPQCSLALFIIWKARNLVIGPPFFDSKINVSGEGGSVRVSRSFVRAVLQFSFRATCLSYSSFTNGIKRKSIPAADVALRIAKVLGTTVEELFDEKSIIDSGAKRTSHFVQSYSKLSERDKSVIDNLTEFMIKA